MIDLIPFLWALLPVAGLLLALGVFRVPAHWATPATLVLTAAVAVFAFGFGWADLGGAVLEGAALALWPIMLVIIAAMFTYNLSVKTGALDTIKTLLSKVTEDRRIQVLILAWGFGGFLEAVAGYGTAVAIPASILAALGFNPLFAAGLSLIANTVPTAFGAVGIPVSTLATLTGLDGMSLSLAVGLQLTPFIVLIPFALVMLTGGGFKALKGVWGITLASGLGFAVPQLLAAAFLGPELPAILGSVGSLITTIGLARLRRKKLSAAGEKAKRLSPVGAGTPEAGPALGGAPAPARVGRRAALKAWAPYLLVFLFVLLASPLVPPIQKSLESVSSSWLFYPGEGGKPLAFKWLATPGVLIIFATFLGGLLQGAKPGLIVSTLGETVWKLNKSTLTVVSILALAKVMGYSGMTPSLAAVLVAATGPVYPLIAPLIGALGTFITGSDTSSNILFGKLQTEVAGGLGQDPIWLAAANTSGATAGKMISPQSIAVATAAIGQTGQEGPLLGRTLPFCFAYVLILGLAVWLVGPFLAF